MNGPWPDVARSPSRCPGGGSCSRSCSCSSPPWPCSWRPGGAAPERTPSSRSSSTTECSCWQASAASSAARPRSSSAAPGGCSASGYSPGRSATSTTSSRSPTRPTARSRSRHWPTSGTSRSIRRSSSAWPLLARAQLVRFTRAFWIDGLLAGLTVAAVAAAVVFDRVLASTGGDAAAVAVNLAYPLGDLILLALVVGFLALGARRVSAPWSPDLARARPVRGLRLRLPPPGREWDLRVRLARRSRLAGRDGPPRARERGDDDTRDSGRRRAHAAAGAGVLRARRPRPDRLRPLRADRRAFPRARGRQPADGGRAHESEPDRERRNAAREPARRGYRPLTGLRNRRSLQASLTELCERSRSNPTS